MPVPIHEGTNVCKVRRFQASPSGPIANMSLYKVTLVNLTDAELVLAYAVPHDKEPHQLLRDLYHFSKNKHWVNITLKSVNNLLSITDMQEITTPQQEMDELSLQKRGGRVSL
jgi:hypothetical protein